MVVHRARQNSHEHDASILEAHDLSHGRIGVFVAHDDESSRRQVHTGCAVTHVAVGKALSVDAVVVQPQIPTHGYKVDATTVNRIPAPGSGSAGRKRALESVERRVRQIGQQYVEVRTDERGQQREPETRRRPAVDNRTLPQRARPNSSRHRSS